MCYSMLLLTSEHALNIQLPEGGVLESVLDKSAAAPVVFRGEKKINKILYTAPLGSRPDVI